ncbi:MAG: acetyltransferase [Phycisphaerae bacterium]|nr:acetyltransferase [Phycisphaerae bacterium]|tara:strand:+ start:241 stop:864 length:624 start_codon:yes stop_codon:yes gene_type:complete
MSDNRLLILGAGGNGRVISDMAEQSGMWSMIAFLDDSVDAHDYPWGIVGSCSDFVEHAAMFTHAIVGFGDNTLRSKWINRIAQTSLQMPTIISESAQVSPRAELGSGTVVMPQAVVNIGAQIGAGCIINTAASVDHDCQLGSCVHIAPGAHVGGHVKIGDRSWIGIGSSIRNGINIGTDVMVGAGGAVISDLADGCTAVGVPAQPRD